MASLAGYNPNASLLPSGGGAIQPMSGGGNDGIPSGYNASASLLPSSGGEIAPFRGGFFMSPGSMFIGGEGETNNTNWNAARDLAGKSIADGTNVESIKNSTPVAPVATVAPVDSSATNPSGTPIANSNVNTTVVSNTTSNDSVVPSAPVNNVAKTLPIISSSVIDSPKLITLFGEQLNLDNPKKLKAGIQNNGNFEGDYLKALELFGVDGPAVSPKEKLEILQAIYDRKCNTDAPLAMLEACEPIRRIVQTLALNLLGKMVPVKSTIIPGKGKEIESTLKPISNAYKEEKLKVTIQDNKVDDTFTICITFGKDQRGLISKKIDEMYTAPSIPDSDIKSTVPSGNTPVNSGTELSAPSGTPSPVPIEVQNTFIKKVKMLRDPTTNPKGCERATNIFFRLFEKRESIPIKDMNDAANAFLSDSETPSDMSDKYLEAVRTNTPYNAMFKACFGMTIDEIKQTYYTPAPTTSNAIVPSSNVIQIPPSSKIHKDLEDLIKELHKATPANKLNTGISGANTNSGDVTSTPSPDSAPDSAIKPANTISPKLSFEQKKDLISGLEKLITAYDKKNTLEDLSMTILGENTKNDDLSQTQLDEINDGIKQLKSLITDDDGKVELNRLERIINSAVPIIVPITAPNAVVAENTSTPAPNAVVAENTSTPPITNSTVGSIQTGGDILTTHGITNPGVGCYCSSVVQMLYSIPEVRNRILKYEECKGINKIMINNSANKSGIDKFNPKYIICELQSIFSDLNKNTTTFENVIENNKILQGTAIDKTHIINIMEAFIEYENTRGTKETTVSINTQQDAQDLLDFILHVIIKDEKFTDMLTLFKFEYKDLTILNNNKTKIPSEASSELILNIDAYKYTRTNKTISIRKLISDYVSIPEEAEARESMPGKLKTLPEIEIPDINAYIFINTIREEYGKYDPDINITIDPIITLDKKQYAYFGSVLYSTRPVSPGASGHYTYVRGKIIDNKKHDVLYNDNMVLYNSDTYTPEKNSKLLIYHRVEGTNDIVEAEGDKYTPVSNNSNKLNKPNVQTNKTATNLANTMNALSATIKKPENLSNNDKPATNPLTAVANTNKTSAPTATPNKRAPSRIEPLKKNNSKQLTIPSPTGPKERRKAFTTKLAALKSKLLESKPTNKKTIQNISKNIARLTSQRTLKQNPNPNAVNAEIKQLTKKYTVSNKTSILKGGAKKTFKKSVAFKSPGKLTQKKRRGT